MSHVIHSTLLPKQVYDKQVKKLSYTDTGRYEDDFVPLSRIKRHPFYKNLVKTLHGASVSDVKEGMDWYRKANLFANSLSQRFNVTVDQAASVIAALSPAAKWERNLLDAENLITAYYHRGYIGAKPVVVTTYGKQKEKALKVLTGELTLTPDQGLKTFNFKHNIADPTNKEFVTIDRHAFRVLQGQREAGAVSLNRNLYRTCKTTYQVVAKEHNLVPCQLQAITWLAYKNKGLNEDE